jgi:pyruvate kinase
MKELSFEPLHLSSPQVLLSTLQELRQTVESEGQATFSQWRSDLAVAVRT